jgi:hypothetical protein
MRPDARQGIATIKGARGPKLSPWTRKSEKRPAVMAKTLFAVVIRARVDEMSAVGRSCDLCSDTYQDSKTEYRQDVETPLRILPKSKT